jgi:hypothetical protein
MRRRGRPKAGSQLQTPLFVWTPTGQTEQGAEDNPRTRACPVSSCRARAMEPCRRRVLGGGWMKLTGYHASR